ncbi:MAG: c-type cytochrome [Pseudomonadota bacterium]
MRSVILSIVAALSLSIVNWAWASEMPEVAKRNHCAGCHAIDKGIIGPAWQAVADKYKGDAAARAKLSASISRGSSGVWGNMLMPPYPKVNDADMKEMVNFIIGLGK